MNPGINTAAQVSPEAGQSVSSLEVGASAVASALQTLREAELSSGQIDDLKAILEKASEKAGPFEQTVNGIEVKVRWDAGYGDYVVYLPQISVGSERADATGVWDQALRIGPDANLAKYVFDLATFHAESSEDSYALMRQLEAIRMK